jgi:putative sigma-54 modulation protein
MEVEFTARQVRITKALREQAEAGLERIARIIGKTANANVILGAQRRLHIAEINIKARLLKIAAEGEGATLELALREALERAESQARRHRDRRLESKRLPKGEKIPDAPPVARTKARAPIAEEETEEKPGRRTRARASIAVHSFPAKPAVVESHIIKAADAIALKPMTLEEAVKDTEFRDRDLLIFHDLAGTMFVLHRRRDGQMELIELP